MMLSNSISNDSVRAIHSVSDLCGKTRAVLEEKFSNLWVSGEVASITTPASGHWYLSLKDDKAQIRCVMFKSANSRCSKPKVGDEVLISGRFSLYEARGDLQLILNHLEPRGAGALHKKFEELKKKLLDEGLFAAENKKEIPKFPQHIAIITSATGAALKDIVTVFERHKYAGRLSIFPSHVQGEDAPKQLVAALNQADALAEIDLILLSRGGGSYEDLFCFNDENLARAIYATKKPVVSAVGHEVDTTICDFVADMRSATPTSGAEQILRAYIDLNPELNRLLGKLSQAISVQVSQHEFQLERLQRRLQSPVHQLENYQQRLDRLQERQSLYFKNRLEHLNHQLALLSQRHQLQSPALLTKNAATRVEEARTKLHRLGVATLSNKRREFLQLGRHLEAVSPMAVLTRGYSILLSEDQKALKSVKQTQPGEKLSALLTDGSLELEVLKTQEKNSLGE